MEQIKIPLERDEARAVQQNFFPYMLQLIAMQVRQTQEELDAALPLRAMHCLLKQTKLQLDRSLLGESHRMKISLPLPNALVLLNAIKRIPLDPKDVWLCHLRGRMVLHLDHALQEPNLLIE